MAKREEPMMPIDWTHLAQYQQEWVALDKVGKVRDHSQALADLRKKLGNAAKDFSYFFVPPTHLGFSGLCHI